MRARTVRATDGPTRFPTLSAPAIREAFESGRYPYARPMSGAIYEAEKLRLRATLLQAIQKEAASWDGTDRSRAKRLGITAPRYTLLKRGQLGEFSLDALVVLAVHAGLSIGLTIEHQAA